MQTNPRNETERPRHQGERAYKQGLSRLRREHDEH